MPSNTRPSLAILALVSIALPAAALARRGTVAIDSWLIAAIGAGLRQFPRHETPSLCLGASIRARDFTQTLKAVLVRDRFRTALLGKGNLVGARWPTDSRSP